MKEFISKNVTYLVGGGVILLLVVVLGVFYFRSQNPKTIQPIYVTPGTVTSDTVRGDLPKIKADSIHQENLREAAGR